VIEKELEADEGLAASTAYVPRTLCHVVPCLEGRSHHPSILSRMDEYSASVAVAVAVAVFAVAVVLVVRKVVRVVGFEKAVRFVRVG
jgi:hypothetical protein